MSKCHLSRSLDKRVPWEMNIPPWEVVGWLGGFLQLARPLGDSDVRQMLLGMVVKKADCSPGWCGSAVPISLPEGRQPGNCYIKNVA